VARTIALLREVAQSDGGTQIKRLAAALQLPASTVHRLLDLLMREGMVERDEQAPIYRVGPEFFRLAAVVYNDHPLQAIAAPFLERMVQTINEAAYLCLHLPREHRMSFASYRESTHPLGYRVRTNEPQSLLTGASGRSILAWLGADELQAVLSAEARAEPTGGAAKTLPGRRALLQDLSAIRSRGYALSFGRRIPGAVGVFAPVFNASGRVIGSLGFTIPEHRYQSRHERDIAACACRFAAELSASLGHRTQASA
jgi:DNA-binding IclR family transcriptional regulator